MYPTGPSIPSTGVERGWSKASQLKVSGMRGMNTTTSWPRFSQKFAYSNLLFCWPTIFPKKHAPAQLRFHMTRKKPQNQNDRWHGDSALVESEKKGEAISRFTYPSARLPWLTIHVHRDVYLVGIVLHFSQLLQRIVAIHNVFVMGLTRAFSSLPVRFFRTVVFGWTGAHQSFSPMDS